MFCPKCATQNADDAKFCRACGADISLVPQALNGQIAERPVAADETHLDGRAHLRRQERGEGTSVERAVSNIAIGIAFLIIFLGGLLFFQRGFMAWVWMIIPAMACLGKGVGQYLRYKQEQERLAPPTFVPAPSLPYQRQSATIAQHGTSELLTPPSSVTEGTTRHLDAVDYVPAKPIERVKE
ncbi:MAG TPA: zinc-ribbon domain-containing protein [Pyrinomonadaceae bacterium]|jgi:hypothetical protein|nr:zinc-ribbon domain-containing protein [Pyrinomonadaceae bacterium]